MQIGLRDTVGFVFSFPIDAEHPPALAVAEKLNAVDAASEGLGVIFGMAGFVGAPYVSDVVPKLSTIGDRVFKKAFFIKECLAASGILVRRKYPDCEDALGIFSARHESGSGVEERTETVPVAFACGAGNNIVERRQQMLRGVHISRTRRRSRI